MSALDAIATVLADAGKPLNTADLVQRLFVCGLWQSHGQKPKDIIGSYLSTDIKKHGVNSRFHRPAPGMFALRSRGFSEHDGPQTARPAPATQPTTTGKTLSFADAAKVVLDQYGNKQPMHYVTITQQALQLGLLQTGGQTPQATLQSQIIREIKQRTKRGESPRFVTHGKGLVGLTDWLPRGLALQIDQHNRAVRDKLHKSLFAMTPPEFEGLVSQLLSALGFADVNVTKASGDGGIDVRGTLVVGDVIRISMAVQVKRWQNNVRAPTVQQVRGSLGAHDQGLIITTRSFSDGARKEAKRGDAVPVALMNGEQLVALLVEHDIGVHRTAYDLIEMGEIDAT